MLPTARRSRRRGIAPLGASLLILAGLVPVAAAPVLAAPTELFISEYIEGSSNNKAIEIYNATGAAVNLGTAGYNIQMFFNGNPVSTLTIGLTGTVANGDVYVVAQSSANATILAQADQTNGSGWFNGDDAVVLRKGTTVIDSLGQAGFDPGSEWGTGLVSTADNTLRRKSAIQAGDTNATDVFDPSIEWDGFATDTFDGLGAHTFIEGDLAPTVDGTFPVDGATDFHLSANLTVTFSEPVDVSGSWFDITCTPSGTHTAVVSGGPTTFTLDPDVDFSEGDDCTLTIIAAQVTDEDGSDPPDNMTVDFTVSFTSVDVCLQPFTPIYQIQGSGSAAAITGNITTKGVVVGDFEGTTGLSGFYLQDVSG
ncbi:MAG TPA: Ig-like domain-containing protein, partial [Candidatus Limnocylindrales bacterium]|nr:Ig-like domain-containing protein [Candidatus Limnocylindrales bacterium]